MVSADGNIVVIVDFVLQSEICIIKKSRAVLDIGWEKAQNIVWKCNAGSARNREFLLDNWR